MIKTFYKKISFIFRRERRNSSGFSLIETLIAVSIVSGILLVVGIFQADVFNLNRVIQSGLQNQNEARKVLRPMINEVRSATISDLGSYPLAEVSTTTFTFFSDIDNDGSRERVRYFLEGNEFKKGITESSGDPLIYDPLDEEIVKVVHNVTNVDIFTYYDSNYEGSTTTPYLSQPVSPSDVRLLKVELIVDSDPDKPPAPLTISTQVSIRNLKDNL